MTLAWLAGLAGLVGAILLVSGVRRLAHGHLWRGCRRCTGAVLLLGLASLCMLAAAHLYTYSRLTHEGKVAEIAFEQQGHQRFSAQLTLADGRRLMFELQGDEWQLDARILKWLPQANLLGFDTLYRLDRLAGRYREIDQERTAQRTVFELASPRGLDLWRIAQDHPGWLPGIDARYGSATYLPMRAGARFDISISTSGLLARPADAATRAMMDEAW